MKATLATIPFAPLVLLVVGAEEAPVAGVVAVVVAAPVPVPVPVVVLLLEDVLNGME